MRKVEQLVNSFLAQGITGKASSNAAVENEDIDHGALLVKLHGHIIAACWQSMQAGALTPPKAG